MIPTPPVFSSVRHNHYHPIIFGRLYIYVLCWPELLRRIWSSPKIDDGTIYNGVSIIEGGCFPCGSVVNSECHNVSPFAIGLLLSTLQPCFFLTSAAATVVSIQRKVPTPWANYIAQLCVRRCDSQSPGKGLDLLSVLANQSHTVARLASFPEIVRGSSCQSRSPYRPRANQSQLPIE